MGLALCILGFAGVAIVTRRSLGHGLGLLLAIGSIYGIARCRIFDGFTHFLFDASVLGAYVGGSLTMLKSAAAKGLRAWLIALGALPLVLVLLSPFLDAQPVLVQLLGLRPALLFLPLMLLGAAADKDAWTQFASWSAFVALGSALVMLGELYWGIEPFFPVNDASRIIYVSKDVGEARNYRLPATFSSSHAYGGTMASLLPAMVLLVEAGGWRRRLGAFALAAAALGIFACGARSPVLSLGLVGAAIGLRAAKRPGLRVAVLLAGIVVGVIVPQESRFQRFETLSDTDYVRNRVSSSVNVGLLDIISDYPLGRGLGSAIGTSIPYFLLAEARPQVGMESEYARIAVEQGVVGVLLWSSFAVWILARNPLRLRKLGGVADIGLWAVCAFSWAQGFIGTGFLASVPATMVLMLYMGLLGTSTASDQPKGIATSRTLGLGRQQRA